MRLPIVARLICGMPSTAPRSALTRVWRSIGGQRRARTEQDDMRDHLSSSFLPRFLSHFVPDVLLEARSTSLSSRPCTSDADRGARRRGATCCRASLRSPWTSCIPLWGSTCVSRELLVPSSEFRIRFSVSIRACLSRAVLGFALGLALAGALRLPFRFAIAIEGALGLPIRLAIAIEGALRLPLRLAIAIEGALRLPIRLAIAIEGALRLPLGSRLGLRRIVSARA